MFGPDEVELPGWYSRWAGEATATADRWAAASLLPCHRHPQLRFAIGDQIAAQVDGHLVQHPGEAERDGVLRVHRRAEVRPT